MSRIWITGVGVTARWGSRRARRSTGSSPASAACRASTRSTSRGNARRSARRSAASACRRATHGRARRRSRIAPRRRRSTRQASSQSTRASASSSAGPPRACSRTSCASRRSCRASCRSRRSRSFARTRSARRPTSLDAAIGPFARVRNVASACSSGATALALAMAWLLADELDAVVAGGTDGLCRLTLSGFNALSAIDPEPCRPFDANGAG